MLSLTLSRHIWLLPTKEMIMPDIEKYNLYKTAILLATNEYVALVKFVPASAPTGNADYFIVRTIAGEVVSAFPSELSSFCL
jgi:hypothetical protein